MREHSKPAVAAMVGIDLAKRSFHVYGADGRGKPLFSKKLTSAAEPFYGQPATLHGGDGGVRQRASLGADLSHLRP